MKEAGECAVWPWEANDMYSTPQDGKIPRPLLAMQAFDWATPGSLIMMANVDDVAFWGNEVVNTAACVNPQGNYKDPVSMVNSTNVQGLAPPASSQAATATLLQRDSAP